MLSEEDVMSRGSNCITAADMWECSDSEECFMLMTELLSQLFSAAWANSYFFIIVATPFTKPLLNSCISFFLSYLLSCHKRQLTCFIVETVYPLPEIDYLGQICFSGTKF